MPEPLQGGAPIVTTEIDPQLRELDLFALIALIARRLPFIAACGLVSFLITVAVMLHAKPRYAATAVMIVPQGNVTSSTLASQLTLSTSDLLGGGYELYSDIITSRTVRDRLIMDNDLKKVYGTNSDETAEDILLSMTKVETAREGLVRVTVQDTDPQRAANLANDYLSQLDVLNTKLVLTSIGAQRAYLEREMIREKNSLADAEVALKRVQESSGGVPPEAQANSGLTAVEQTRAQLRALEINLASLLTGATEANPDVVRLRQQIASLRQQLEGLQHGSANSDDGVPTSKVPEQALIYTRLLRDVKFHETLFDLLEKQFESAKQQESKTPSIVQMLDPAVASKHKAWPPRTYYCLIAAVAGVVGGTLLVALWAVLSAYFKNPRNVDKLNQLKAIYRR